MAEFGAAYEENEFVGSLVPGERPVSFEGLAVEDEGKDLYVSGERPGHSQGPVVVYSEAGVKLAEARELRTAVRVSLWITRRTRIRWKIRLRVVRRRWRRLGNALRMSAGAGEASGGIEKLDREGVEEAFSFTKACEKEGCGYVHGGKITGIPGQPTAIARLGATVAVDPHGDIYAASRETSRCTSMRRVENSSRYSNWTAGSPTPGRSGRDPVEGCV